MRQRRERQQIALTTIADQTKIKLSLLEALERDDVSHWPSGIFRRAFIRAYAHAIGLEPDVVVRDFLAFHPDPIEEVSTVPSFCAVAPGVEGATTNSGPPTRFRFLVGTAIDSLSRLRNGNAQKSRSAAPDAAPTVDQDAAPAVERDVAPAVDHDRAPAVEAAPAKPLTPFEPDLLAAAQLCTELGRVDDARDAAPWLKEAARILDAIGLIVWLWDPQATELIPALTHGYSDKVLAQLPTVRRDADNATAAAFRTAQTCVVNGSDLANDALVVPLMTSAGCTGVLAIELPYGGVQRESVRALVTIFASQLARLVGAGRSTDAVDRRLA
jgi:hypothetical protein